MTHLHLDFETASECDLRKHGLMRYAKHASTRVLMLGWAFDDEPVQLWQPHLDPDMPARVRDALADPSVTKVAHNAQFERAIIEDVLKLTSPVEQWRCTMVSAYLLALPGSLQDLGKVIGLPEEQQKAKTGATLIRRFCMPREPTQQKPWRWSTPHNEPEDWKLFCDYCVQDVATERLIFKKLSKFHIPDSEWRLWCLDQEINRRGVPVDVEFVRAALDVAAAEKKRLLGEMKAITGLANPGSTAQILPWLRERGYPFSDMRKERVTKALEDFDNWTQQPPYPNEPPAGSSDEVMQRYFAAQHRHESFQPLDDDAKAVLRLHQQASKSSWKKYQAILDYEYEGRLYYQFQFAGAGRTARWAGRGVQLQNLPRPAKAHEDHLDHIRDLISARDLEGLALFYGNVMACLASALRSAIATQDDTKLVVADLSSIESRALAWLARCDALLDVFRTGKCAYKSFATRMFNKPYDEITKRERQDAKPAVLGCGYRLGGGAEIGEYPDVVKTGLFGYAEMMGVKFTKEQAHESVRVFRESYPEIVQFWYDLENAAMSAVRTQQPQVVGPLQFDIKAPFLRMRLPSGRFVHYLRPRIEKVKSKLPSGDVIEKWQTTYEGYSNKREWCRMATHGGRFTEQATQALSRDILAHGMSQAAPEGFLMVGTTHDEIIAEQPEWDILDEHVLSHCMSVVPSWAKGLPLGAEGYTSQVYRK